MSNNKKHRAFRVASLLETVRTSVIGRARNIRDPQLFHQLSLAAFFAWVGLGADGLSSSAYGPAEAFLTLGGHPYLGIFVALATAVTIFVITSSYSQIVELFPGGGGGYLVASKLLSPLLGMISGCALLIDYVLTITLSIASGADALFSFLPPALLPLRLVVAVGGVLVLLVLNMRGVRESVMPLIPIFVVFLISHAFAIVYGLLRQAPQAGALVGQIQTDLGRTAGELGIVGMLILVLRAYSMGAGTFTGIEAVSNGMPVLREPRVQTARTTMHYMAASLAFMAVGLMVGYLLYRVRFVPGKTLNAVFFEGVTAGWGPALGDAFVVVTLLSEALILFVAAQTGFLDGPRVMANMSLDQWLPKQFSLLSERLVIKNGIVLMGLASIVLMIATRGSVGVLVILYSINVFITFTLSQLGMVRHWWRERRNLAHWRRRLAVATVGMLLSAFILISVVVLKFREGGWVTVLLTGSLAFVAYTIRRFYDRTGCKLRRLDKLMVGAVDASSQPAPVDGGPPFDPAARTAGILVSGFNGTGLHTLLNVRRNFGDLYRNYLFIEAGIIDTDRFKGAAEINRLRAHVRKELDRYTALMQREGFYARGYAAIGTDVVDEVYRVVSRLARKYPQCVFFGGQIVFREETFLTRTLFNYTAFAVQRRLHQDGVPFIIMPIRVS